MIYMNPDNYMNVGEVKKFIEGLDDDVVFVLSSDGEGNSFSPLAGMDRVMYVPESTWDGYIWNEDDALDDLDDEELEALGEDAHLDPPDDAVSAVVLWPVN